MAETLTADEVRRAVLRAQGFGRGGPAPTARTLAAAIGRLGLLQVDSVNVVIRAHYLPLFSRLGPYDTAALDRLSQQRPRKLFEYWGHEASLIPVQTQPLLRWRMADGHAWTGPHRVARERPQLIDDVRAAVAEHGPMSAARLERVVAGEHPRSQDYAWGWNWSDVKRALEYLFGIGEVSAAGRDRTFTRLYDLPERVIPPGVLRSPTPPRAEAIRGLVEIAARALAVATEADLRDYWKLPAAATRAAVADLLEAGALRPVEVPGWPAAYRHRDAVVPRSSRAHGLLSPFDPMIWNRPRVERVFGMRYRIEIYTPAARREFGYYVLPYLHGGRLVARLDLKADRDRGVLLVRGGWSQHLLLGTGHPAPEAFVPDLAGHLHQTARWLGLDGVGFGADRGDLPAALRRAG